MSEELSDHDRIRMLMEYNSILEGRLEGLSVAVNALAIMLTGTKPEHGKIARNILISLAQEREQSSPELEDELAVSCFRSQVEDVVGHISVE